MVFSRASSRNPSNLALGQWHGVLRISPCSSKKAWAMTAEQKPDHGARRRPILSTSTQLLSLASVGSFTPDGRTADLRKLILAL